MTTPDELRDRLDYLGLSQRGAARVLHIDERTMRRYCSGQYPVPEVVWLALLGLKPKKAKDRSAWSGFRSG